MIGEKEAARRIELWGWQGGRHATDLERAAALLKTVRAVGDFVQDLWRDVDRHNGNRRVRTLTWNDCKEVVSAALVNGGAHRHAGFVSASNRQPAFATAILVVCDNQGLGGDANEADAKKGSTGFGKFPGAFARGSQTFGVRREGDFSMTAEDCRKASQIFRERGMREQADFLKSFSTWMPEASDAQR